MRSIDLVEWLKMMLGGILDNEFDKSSIEMKNDGRIMRITVEEVFEIDKKEVE